MKYYLRSYLVGNINEVYIYKPKGRVKTIPRGQDPGESRSRGQVNHELVFTYA